jgi:hypothetical protein
MSDSVRWVVMMLAALGVILLLAYARNDPGVGCRVPDPEDVRVIVIETN